MLAVGVAVPVVVLNEVHALVGLERGHLVRTVGAGGLNGGVVGGGPSAVGLGQAGVVQVGLDQPVAGQVVQQVEASQGLAQNQSDFVVTALVQADGVVGNIGGVGPLDVQLVQNPLISGSLISAVLVDSCIDEEGNHVVHGNSGSLDLIDQRITPSLGLEIVGTAEGVVPVDVSNGLTVLCQEGIHISHALISHNSCNGDDLGQALVCVSLSASDAEAGLVVTASAVVLQLGIQQTLHGLNVVVSSDGGAIFPGCQGVQLDNVSEALGSGLGDAELRTLSLDGLGDVLGHSSCHLGNDHVSLVRILAFKGVQLIVEDEAVQAAGQEVDGVSLIVGLVGVGVPVSGQGGNPVGVGEVTLEGLDDHGCFGGCYSGLNRCFGGCAGGLGRTGVTTASEQAQHHSCGQQQGEKLLHFISSYNFFIHGSKNRKIFRFHE